MGSDSARPFRIRLTDWERDREALIAVRFEVFVREQKVPEDMEVDAMDPLSRHAIAEDEAGRAIGTGRLLPDGHIGRMAVLREWRQYKVGSALLEALIALGAERGHREVVLSAQTHAIPFYERFGFLAYGPVYDDCGIPHRDMRLSLEHPATPPG
jgi:predicted GNAT family N-acyltransferase